MFSYEENEKAVNKAIFKCLNERFEFGGFDEPESFSGNTTGGMSIKQGYEIPKKIDIKLEITSKNKKQVVGNVFTKNPKTGKPIEFKNVVFEKAESDWTTPEWADQLEGMWHEIDSDASASDYETEYRGLFGFIESIVECKYPKDYNGFGSHESYTIYPLLNKLVKKGSISLPNPFFKK
ncbi:MAG: hypothetical protein J6R59_00270 [Paludibacteraceae bacterium]|nr:hypothetical protein [Paludibacteraceae bacterium]